MKLILLILLTVLIFASLEIYSDAACIDLYNHCDIFVERYYCKSREDFARKWCEKTCGFCGTTTAPPTTVPPTTEEPETVVPWTGSCGKPEIQGQRVVGGVKSTRGSWPWQILLMFYSRGGCGGSIVGPRHVITAAHCVDKRTLIPQAFKVRVGEYNKRTKEGSEEEYQVRKIFQHPDYNSPTALNNDIAVLELDKPIRFNKYVQPVCLPEKNVAVGTECYITGWGKVRHPGSSSNILQQAKMPVVSKTECDAKNRNSIGITVTDAMLCSGDGGISRKSGCHGDSGGPFVCKVNSRWELHGAVSHGSPRCSSSETYSVYARIAYFKDWIEKIMKQ